MIDLRDYQADALAAINQALGRGVRRQLAVLPTGTGKTILFARLITDRAGRALVLAHRDELIGQAADKLLMVNPTAKIGIVKAADDQHTAETVVASVQTLAVPGRRQRLARDFATVVIDEAHHAAAPTYGKVLDHVTDPARTLLVGVTATPDRSDGVGLAGVFDEIVYTADLLDMIRRGYLADLRAIRVELAADLDRVTTRGGDLDSGELGDALTDAGAPELVAQAWTGHCQGRTGLVFTPTVATAHQMAQAFRAAGVTAEALDGATPTGQRHDILARLAKGTTSVVANCAVLTEGFDCPRVDAVVIARPTSSRALYQQMIGRGTRLYPGKTDCLIVDVVGVTGRHKLITAASLLGLPADQLAAAGARRAAAHADHAQPDHDEHDHDRRRVDGRLVAREVDLFGDRPMRWVRSGSGFVLNLGRGYLALEPATDGWQITRTDTRTGADRQPHTVAAGLSLEYAQGTAEDLVRREGAVLLNNPNAPWRSLPATTKQVHALRRCRIPVRPGLTRGEASDLLTAKTARRRVSAS